MASEPEHMENSVKEKNLNLGACSTVVENLGFLKDHTRFSKGSSQLCLLLAVPLYKVVQVIDYLFTELTGRLKIPLFRNVHHIIYPIKYRKL